MGNPHAKRIHNNSADSIAITRIIQAIHSAKFEVGELAAYKQRLAGVRRIPNSQRRAARLRAMVANMESKLARRTEWLEAQLRATERKKGVAPIKRELRQVAAVRRVINDAKPALLGADQ